MKEHKKLELTPLVSEVPGYYCDPLTGECYSGLPKESEMTTKIDPVCKMEVKVEDAQHSSEFNGETYYFCSAACKSEFDENPSKFVAQAA
jgi:YHS domain-containing protein